MKNYTRRVKKFFNNLLLDARRLWLFLVFCLFALFLILLFFLFANFSEEVNLTRLDDFQAPETAIKSVDKNILQEIIEFLNRKNAAFEKAKIEEMPQSPSS